MSDCNRSHLSVIFMIHCPEISALVLKCLMDTGPSHGKVDSFTCVFMQIRVLGLYSRVKYTNSQNVNWSNVINNLTHKASLVSICGPCGLWLIWTFLVTEWSHISPNGRDQYGLWAILMSFTYAYSAITNQILHGVNSYVIRIINYLKLSH